MIDIEKLAKECDIDDYYSESPISLKQFAESYASELKADNENLVRINNLQAQEIVELQSHINDLRDALNAMRDAFDIGGDVTSDENTALYKADKSIVKTPAQSLQEHDNEVIEKCAKVCDEMAVKYDLSIDPVEELIACETSATIRALKGK